MDFCTFTLRCEAVTKLYKVDTVPPFAIAAADDGLHGDVAEFSLKMLLVTQPSQ